MKSDHTQDPQPDFGRDDALGVELEETGGSALVLENARLRAELAQREQLGAVMASVVVTITSIGDQHEIMTKVVALAGAALGADSCYIALLKDRAWKPAYLWQLPSGFAGTDIAVGQMPLAALALRAARPVAIDDCEDGNKVDPELRRRWGLRALLAAPMMVRNELLGGLFFHYTGGVHHFSPSEIAFAQSVAGATSQALQAARLLEQQRLIAVTLQENFIHPLPKVRGLELSVVSKTAHVPELVGGDFSDVFLLNDHHVAILIGDVAGKGIRAAGLTETLRSTVRAFAAVDPSPAYVLTSTNQLLLRREVGEELATAFLVILDTQSGRALCASAAHPPAVHLSDSFCRLLEVPSGVPLGSFEEDYQNAELRLADDDVLVLYTDGVIEARRGPELFGYERLLEAVSGLRGATMKAISDGLSAAAEAFCGRLQDDLHVVALRRAGGRHSE